ncbi:thioesterase II family protein [Streptomyces fradiae]|uniref:thioesterase II family protein n=1 Tax=Streptomyces fradiae TaxID=1906 RepID=UPI0033EC8084
MSRYPLVLLHHSGGTAQVFSGLVRALPDWIEPVPLELPGRGRRRRDAPVHTAEDAVDDLAARLEDAGVTGEFAVFGHSMGAYLGLSLAARQERAAGRARCSVLFASANAGPLAAKPLFDGDPLEADDEEVLRVAGRFGGLAPQILEHEQLRRHAARLQRADFAVCDSFIRTLRGTKTESHLVVCCGTADVFTDAELDSWRLSSAASTERVRFPGGHFYLADQAEAVAETVATRLAALANPAALADPALADPALADPAVANTAAEPALSGADPARPGLPV